MSDEPYAQVREHLGFAIGQTIVDVTQHDEEHFQKTGERFTAFHLSNGSTITFSMAPGQELAFCIDTPDNDEDEEEETV